MALPDYLQHCAEAVILAAKGDQESWGRGRTSFDGLDAAFVAAWEGAETIAEIDLSGDYEYDTYSLVQTSDGRAWLVNTAGCSCPDPADTWSVNWVEASAQEARARVDAEAAKELTDYPEDGNDYSWDKRNRPMVALLAELEKLGYGRSG